MAIGYCGVCFLNRSGYIQFNCGHGVCLKCMRKLEKLRSHYNWANFCPLCRNPIASNRPTGLRTPFNDNRSISELQLAGNAPIESDDSVVPPDLRQATEVFLKAVRQALLDPSNSPFPKPAGPKLVITSSFKPSSICISSTEAEENGAATTTTTTTGSNVPENTQSRSDADSIQNGQNGDVAENQDRHNNPASAF